VTLVMPDKEETRRSWTAKNWVKNILAGFAPMEHYLLDTNWHLKIGDDEELRAALILVVDRLEMHLTPDEIEELKSRCLEIA